MSMKSALITSILALATGVMVGWVVNGWRLDSRLESWKTEQAEKLAKAEQKAKYVSDKVVTEYIDRVKIVKEKGNEIVKQVPIYIAADEQLSGSFRLLHDAAVSGEIVDAASVANAAPVPAQDVAGTVTENYVICKENTEQLKALQEWVRYGNP